MSRSNPTEYTPNPATRFFEWNGEQGVVRYFDKERRKNVDVGTIFRFVLLDELGTVKGWHEPSQSGIYANEVRDTRTDLLIVKAFKAGVLAEGLYKDIKDRVATAGGHFVANCYIAFKGETNGDLALGAIQFKGAALGAWMEFRKAHRALLYQKAIEIVGFSEGKKGRVIFRTPTFRLTELSQQSNDLALELDKGLQTYLDGYLKRAKRDQADLAPHAAPVAPADYDDRAVTYEDGPEPDPDWSSAPVPDDDIPF